MGVEAFSGELLRLWNSELLPIVILNVALMAGSSKQGKAKRAPNF
jgi:hypothetical protein